MLIVDGNPSNIEFLQTLFTHQSYQVYSAQDGLQACQISKKVGADFVKTSTGFGPGGATVEDIKLMRETVGPAMGVKASGGIRTGEDVKNMIEAGATRIGASASVAIVTGGTSDSTY